MQTPKLLIMTSLQFDQSINVIQVSVKNGSWRDHFSLEGGEPPKSGIDKQGAWKANIEVVI